MRLTIGNSNISIDIPEESRCFPKIEYEDGDTYNSAKVFLCVFKHESFRLLGDVVTLRRDIIDFHPQQDQIERKLQQEVERNALQSL